MLWANRSIISGTVADAMKLMNVCQGLLLMLCHGVIADFLGRVLLMFC